MHASRHVSDSLRASVASPTTGYSAARTVWTAPSAAAADGAVQTVRAALYPVVGEATLARRESLTCRDACIGRGQTERPGPRGGRSAEGQPVAAQQQRSHGDRTVSYTHLTLPTKRIV